MGETDPPATRCAHDFATGRGFPFIGFAAAALLNGRTSPFSRDPTSCAGTDCDGDAPWRVEVNEDMNGDGWLQPRPGFDSGHAVLK